jgi:hypothetical protein
MNAHTDNVIEQLTKSADKLKLLDIRGARYLTPRALVKIPAWNIQHLSISNCPKLHTEQLEMAFTKVSIQIIFSYLKIFFLDFIFLFLIKI